MQFKCTILSACRSFSHLLFTYILAVSYNCILFKTLHASMKMIGKKLPQYYLLIFVRSAEKFKPDIVGLRIVVDCLIMCKCVFILHDFQTQIPTAPKYPSIM